MNMPRKSPQSAAGGLVPVLPAPSPRPEPDSGDLFDYALIGNCLGFAARAVRRNRALSGALFGAVLSLALTAFVVMPKTYRVQTTIFALRNPVMSTLSNPGLFRPYESDAPTRAAKETVLRRDNLVSLCNRTDLLDTWQRTRAPAVRMMDFVMRVLTRRERTREELMDAMVERLEKRLIVDVSEGTVTLTLEWPHPGTALQIVEAAVENFLEARHSTEISIVGDAISILQSHATGLQQRIDAVLNQFDAKERSARAKIVIPPLRREPAVRRTPPAVAQDTARLQNQLATKRRAIADLEEFRQRRIAELQAQLAQYQSTYAEQHPAVVSTRQSIDALSARSPQVEALRSEAQEIERSLLLQGSNVPPDTSTTTRMAEAMARPLSLPSEIEDAKATYEKGQLRLLLNSHQNVLERIDAARMEMDTAQAAFKYRYGVISPPQLPKRPTKPSLALTLASGLLAGALFAVFGAVVVDLRSKRALESWQVRRYAGIDHVVEVRG